MSRILFITTQSEMGGAQRYLLELAPYLVSRGHEIVVSAGQGDDELFSKIRNSPPSGDLPQGEKFDPVIRQVTPSNDWGEIRNKFKLYKIPNLIRTLNPLKDIRALIKILEIIKNEKPDVLFLQSTKAGLLGSIAARLYRIYCFMFSPCGRSLEGRHVSCFMRVVYRIGGWSFQDPRPWWMNKILFGMEKISAPWKDVIIVNSEFDRQIATEKKIAQPGKIVKIYNGIDPEKLHFLTREEARMQIPNFKNAKIIGTIANLYATKGIEYLIEAAHLLPSIPHTLPPILFVVVGEGKERPKLEALIKKYNLQDKFFLIGRLPNAYQYLKAFDIFVLPSLKEGFPWVLLEAMAAKVPIVATKVGAVPEVIEDGKEGLLVLPKDPQALAEKIQQLVLAQSAIHHSHDRGNDVRSEILSKNASEKLKQFSLQKMLEESEKVILNQSPFGRSPVGRES